MQKTAYEMRISDWSSDVCSSDLSSACPAAGKAQATSAATAPDSSSRPRRIADCRRFLNSAAGVVVIQPRDVAFVQDFAKLNLDEDQQLAACVAGAVLGAAGNDYMVAGLELRDGLVDGGLAVDGDDPPGLRRMAG